MELEVAILPNTSFFTLMKGINKYMYVGQYVKRY